MLRTPRQRCQAFSLKSQVPKRQRNIQLRSPCPHVCRPLPNLPLDKRMLLAQSDEQVIVWTVPSGASNLLAFFLLGLATPLTGFATSKINKIAMTCKSFRMNTCKSVSKQRVLTSFRMNTYAKPTGRGQTKSGSEHERRSRPNRQQDAIHRPPNLRSTSDCATTLSSRPIATQSRWSIRSRTASELNRP